MISSLGSGSLRSSLRASLALIEGGKGVITSRRLPSGGQTLPIAGEPSRMELSLRAGLTGVIALGFRLTDALPVPTGRSGVSCVGSSPMETHPTTDGSGRTPILAEGTSRRVPCISAAQVPAAKASRPGPRGEGLALLHGLWDTSPRQAREHGGICRVVNSGVFLTAEESTPC